MPEPRWTLERVVGELRQLHAGGETISYAGLRAAGFGSLVTAAERYVGSFSRAVKLAGIAPARPAWTRQRVIGEIKRLHREGVALSCEALAKGGKSGLVHAARKHFGSWPDAVGAAGAPRFKRGPWTSWPLVRDRLRALHREGARMTIAALGAKGHADLVAAAQSCAGSWNEALTKANVPVVQEHRRWNAKLVLAEIRALHRAGVTLNGRRLSTRGHAKLVKAAAQYFGTWNAACRAAVPGHRPMGERWTIERLLREIRTRHRTGLSVRSTIVAKHAPTLTGAARRLGIPWREACVRAGVPKSALAPLKAPTRVRWNERRIGAELEKAMRAGRLLVTRSFPGGFVGAVHRIYGSWAVGMNATGFGRQYARDRAAAIADRGRVRTA